MLYFVEILCNRFGVNKWPLVFVVVLMRVVSNYQVPKKRSQSPVLLSTSSDSFFGFLFLSFLSYSSHNYFLRWYGPASRTLAMTFAAFCAMTS